jgi:hypothetical protein
MLTAVPNYIWTVGVLCANPFSSPWIQIALCTTALAVQFLIFQLSPLGDIAESLPTLLGKHIVGYILLECRIASICHNTLQVYF